MSPTFRSPCLTSSDIDASLWATHGPGCARRVPVTWHRFPSTGFGDRYIPHTHILQNFCTAVTPWRLLTLSAIGWRHGVSPPDMAPIGRYCCSFPESSAALRKLTTLVCVRDGHSRPQKFSHARPSHEAIHRLSLDRTHRCVVWRMALSDTEQ
jgi:hypothetical protein